MKAQKERGVYFGLLYQLKIKRDANILMSAYNIYLDVGGSALGGHSNDTNAAVISIISINSYISIDFI